MKRQWAWATVAGLVAVGTLYSQVFAEMITTHHVHKHVATRVNKAQANFPLTVTDEAGHQLTIKVQPKRIASTTEGTDEILSALVPKKDVVMVTTYATSPEFSEIVNWAKGIHAINQVNAEQVLSVNPDLVLMASYNSPAIVQQIEQTGAPVFEFQNFTSIQSIEANIKIVGRLVGKEAVASHVVQVMNRQLTQMHRDVTGTPTPTVLDYGSYGYVAGKDTTVDSIIKAAGGVNAAGSIEGWKQVTDEEIVKLNPQVIIDSSDDAAFIKKMYHDKALQTVPAVAHHRVYLINSARLSAVSQYIVRAVRDVAEALHPTVKLPLDSQLQ